MKLAQRHSIIGILAFAPLLAGGATSNASSPIAPRVPSVCQIDTEMSNYTLGRIREVLDPAEIEADSMTLKYRIRNGLTGLLFANIVVVQDSITCEKARVAYAALREPTETVARNLFLEGVPAVFLVRLSPDRFVVTAGIFDPWWMYEHYLLDDRFRLVAKYM